MPEIEVYTGTEVVKVQYDKRTVFNAIQTRGKWCIEANGKVVFACVSRGFATNAEDALRHAVRALWLVVEKPVRMPTDAELFG